MTDAAHDNGMLMLLLGAVALLAIPLRSLLRRISLPGSVAFILLGVLLSFVDHNNAVLPPGKRDAIAVFAQIGIVALLFRVGLESDLGALLGQLRRAALIWIPDVTVSAALAFTVVWFWPGLGLIPAIITAIAASATSIGVSVAAWEDARMINTPESALLLDVAELDDLSAALLLGVVFVIAIQLKGDTGTFDVNAATVSAAIQIAKIVAFCAICFAFSRLAERRLSRMFAGFDRDLGPFMFAAGMVFVIAALADALGFSMAIGGLFAGLAFSRDPVERRIDMAFGYVLALFGPFFFISIGLSVTTQGLMAALPLAGALLVVLSLGKLLGAGLPAALLAGQRSGALLGVSMIPRAEIFLIVMLGGLQLGEWAVPHSLYMAAVLASLGTCLLGPFLVVRLLATHKRKEQEA
ncbi:cation:proton antiporter [Yoonia sp.]|uniref:cation:proton antiporter n=1 Tax=Yoonia sp. TaxID=2212373 RepID=UPI003F6BEAAC